MCYFKVHNTPSNAAKRKKKKYGVYQSGGDYLTKWDIYLKKKKGRHTSMLVALSFSSITCFRMVRDDLMASFSVMDYKIQTQKATLGDLSEKKKSVDLG